MIVRNFSKFDFNFPPCEFSIFMKLRREKVWFIIGWLIESKMKKKKKKEEREKDKSVHTYIRLNIYEYFQRLYRQDCARVGLFSRTNQFFHGIRSCNNFRGSCAFPLTYFPLSTISLVELDRCAAVPYRKRIGAQTSTRLLHLYDPFPFLFFFFLYFHRLSRFEPTLCNSRSFFRTSFMVEKIFKIIDFN